MHIHSMKLGTCENCDKEKVEIFAAHHNFMMCRECYDKEQEAMKQMNEAQRVIDTSRKIDTSITLKADLFNAQTVAFVELFAAIDANPDIPADQKQLAKTKECEARVLHFQQLLSTARQQVEEYGNAVR